MHESRALIPETFREIDFYDDTLVIALVRTKAFVALRPIAGYLGLDWSAQRQRLVRDEVLSRHMASVVMEGADGRRREMVCLQLEYLAGWLFGIMPSRVRPELASKLTCYREECFCVLWQVFQVELTATAVGISIDQQSLRAACLRAEKLGLPATLTVVQWLVTLDHFGWRCAYCQDRPGIIIEHFIPVSLGGGTTVDNCIPSCYACNSKKGNNHPDMVTTIPRGILNAIRSRLVHLSESVLSL
jgi:P22_AR N-terminal domain/HNH endonuclease